jgi:hypothetical protein
VTFREILAEFASYRQGVDTQYEVHLFQRVSPRGEALDGFDIEDPQAMAAEQARLERIKRSCGLSLPGSGVFFIRRSMSSAYGARS